MRSSSHGRHQSQAAKYVAPARSTRCARTRSCKCYLYSSQTGSGSECAIVASCSGNDSIGGKYLQLLLRVLCYGKIVLLQIRAVEITCQCRHVRLPTYAIATRWYYLHKHCKHVVLPRRSITNTCYCHCVPLQARAIARTECNDIFNYEQMPLRSRAIVNT